MQVIEIKFRGYKGYDSDPTEKRFQHLALAPLNFVFGRNNSGKSAAVRLPRLLLGGLECNDDRLLPLEVRGLNYGGSFLDVVHGGSFLERPSFEILAEDEGVLLDISATLYSENAFVADEPPRLWSFQMRAPDTFSIAPPRRGESARRKFKGLLPPEPTWDRWRKAASDLLDKMIHLGPTRARIRAIYPNEQFAGFGLDGAGTPQLLRIDTRLAERVGAWFATHMEGWRLTINRESESFGIWLKRSDRLVSNLAQGGEGMQQVLPIVAHQIWRQQNDTGPFLDVVEQPELHLHPAAQAPLTDLFVTTALQGRGKTLVETNSKAILLRLQRQIAEAKLAPNMIAIYFVEMTDGGAQLKRVGINQSGDLDWWPAGVFEEDFTEVAAIRRAQRNYGVGKEQV